MTSSHVVMWSGGITSWATARHVIREHGTASVTLLFADTLPPVNPTLIDKTFKRRLAEYANPQVAPRTPVGPSGPTPKGPTPHRVTNNGALMTDHRKALNDLTEEEVFGAIGYIALCLAHIRAGHPISELDIPHVIYVAPTQAEVDAARHMAERLQQLTEHGEIPT